MPDSLDLASTARRRAGMSQYLRRPSFGGSLMSPGGPDDESDEEIRARVTNLLAEGDPVVPTSSPAQEPGLYDRFRKSAFGRSVPGLAVRGAVAYNKAATQAIGKGLGWAARKFMDPLGEADDPLANPQPRPGEVAESPRDPLAPVEGIEKPSPQTIANSRVTDEDVIDRPAPRKTADPADYAEYELLGDSPDAYTKATYKGKEYDYTGAGRGLPKGELIGGKGSVSFAGVSRIPGSQGSTPMIDELEAREHERRATALKRETEMASGGEALRVARQSPEEKAMEAQFKARKELEAIIGTDQQTYIRNAGQEAEDLARSDDRFQLLKPPQQAAMLLRQRKLAEQQASQDFIDKMMALYMKRWNQQF